MKCPICGQDNSQDSCFCEYCGRSLPQGIPASQMTPAAAMLAAAQKKKDAQKRARRIALVCGAWAAVLVALLLLLLLRNRTGSEEGGDDTLRSEVSTGESDSQVELAEWSAWSDALPSGVTEADYTIETQTLYRTRERQTTTAAQDTLDGWTLVGSEEVAGEYGDWSAWSTDKPAASLDRETQSQTRYRYRGKETTTASTASLSGWTQYDVSYAWSDYGAWSGWSTSYVSASDSRAVQTKTQYRYRTISYSTAYTSWSSWSGWQWDAVSGNSLTDVETRTVYGYYWFQCPNCGAHMHGWDIYCPTWAGGCGKAYIPESNWHTIYSTTAPSSVSFKDWYGTGHYYAYVDGELVFRWDYGNPGPQTQYRYRTRTSYQVKNYGSWSNWRDTYYSSSDTRDVESRTLYRYRDRVQKATYYFYRWGNWSEWSSDAVSSSSDREVETGNFYRYRDRVYGTLYHFSRYTDWSAWSLTPQEANSALEVEQKTQYRYQKK